MPKTKRRLWTVILLYPDYMTDDYGLDTYVAWVSADTPEDAVPVAQMRAVEAQRDLSRKATVDVCDAEDFAVVAVIAGRRTVELDGFNYYPRETKEKACTQS
jgi:hypothetical protein